MNYYLEEETYEVRGALMRVFNDLGCGFMEKVYQEALELELKSSNIPFEREKALQLYYRGIKLKQEYVADFICYGKIIVELKAVSELTDKHRAQVFNYLKATNLDLGLLVNFGETSLKIERLFNYRKNQSNQSNQINP